MDHGDDLAATDAAVAHEARRDLIQSKGGPEGPAVDHSDDFVATDAAAVAHEEPSSSCVTPEQQDQIRADRLRHLLAQCRHDEAQCGEPAVDHSRDICDSQDTQDEKNSAHASHEAREAQARLDRINPFMIADQPEPLVERHGRWDHVDVMLNSQFVPDTEEQWAEKNRNVRQAWLERKADLVRRRARWEAGREEREEREREEIRDSERRRRLESEISWELEHNRGEVAVQGWGEVAWNVNPADTDFQILGKVQRLVCQHSNIYVGATRNIMHRWLGGTGSGGRPMDGHRFTYFESGGIMHAVGIRRAWSAKLLEEYLIRQCLNIYGPRCSNVSTKSLGISNIGIYFVYIVTYDESD